MNISFRPISLNETSLRIRLLHQSLKTLGFPVAETEEKSYTAGKTTLKQVRAFQARLNIKFDDKFVVDQPTCEAINNELTKAGLTVKTHAFVVSGAVNDINGEINKRPAIYCA